MNKIIFLASLLALNIIPIFGNTLFYQVFFTKNFNLEQFNITIVKNGTAILYLTPSSVLQNTYEVGIHNLTVALYRDEVELWNEGTCQSFKDKLDEFSQTFAAVYDENKLLKYIKVQESEEGIIKNIKLFLITAMQANNSKLHQEQDFVQDKEVTSFGKCNVDYNLKLLNKEYKQRNFLINKNYDTKGCSIDISDQAAEDSEYINNICKSEKENNLQWSMNSELLASKTVNTDQIIKNTNFNLDYRFDTFKNSDAAMSGDLKIVIKLLDPSDVPTDIKIRKYTDTNTVKLSQMAYKPVNKNLLSETESTAETGLQSLRELYRSLACMSSILNFEYDLVENAVTCLNN